MQGWRGAAGGVSEGGTVGVGGGGAVAWQLELPDGADKLEWRGGGEGASGTRQSVTPPPALPPAADLALSSAPSDLALSEGADELEWSGRCSFFFFKGASFRVLIRN